MRGISPYRLATKRRRVGDQTADIPYSWNGQAALRLLESPRPPEWPADAENQQKCEFCMAFDETMQQHLRYDTLNINTRIRPSIFIADRQCRPSIFRCLYCSNSWGAQAHGLALLTALLRG